MLAYILDSVKVGDKFKNSDTSYISIISKVSPKSLVLTTTDGNLFKWSKCCRHYLRYKHPCYHEELGDLIVENKVIGLTSVDRAAKYLNPNKKSYD